MCLNLANLTKSTDVGNAMQRLNHLVEKTKGKVKTGLCRNCQKSMVAKGLRSCSRLRQV